MGASAASQRQERGVFSNPAVRILPTNRKLSRNGLRGALKVSQAPMRLGRGKSKTSIWYSCKVLPCHGFNSEFALAPQIWLPYCTPIRGATATADFNLEAVLSKISGGLTSTASIPAGATSITLSRPRAKATLLPMRAPTTCPAVTTPNLAFEVPTRDSAQQPAVPFGRMDCRKPVLHDRERTYYDEERSLRHLN